MSFSPRSVTDLAVGNPVLESVDQIEVAIYLTSGQQHSFYQSDPVEVKNILESFDGQLFNRHSLVVKTPSEVIAFRGSAILGISIITDDECEAVLRHERESNTLVTHISEEIYMDHRASENVPHNCMYSELEFITGDRLFLAFSPIDSPVWSDGLVPTAIVNSPVLYCRDFVRGFSIWNTGHVVRRAYFPRVTTPAGSWAVETDLSQQDPL